MPESRLQINKILGYLPQDVAFQEWRTVDHVLKTFGKLSGLSKEKIGNRTEELLTLIGYPNQRTTEKGSPSFRRNDPKARAGSSAPPPP